MTRRPKQPLPRKNTAPDADAILQVEVWLLGISPMVWRSLLVPAGYSLGELHGVFQVAMGWEGIHLYQFRLRAARYGSLELSASSPDGTLAALRFRKGARFLYEYDLNISWRHEVRVEDWRVPAADMTYPACTGGACPPEDCGGPASFMAGRDDLLSLEAMDDLETMAEILGEVAQERRSDLLEDDEIRWRLERTVERSKARGRAQGRPFSRRQVNARLRQGEHLELMHQQW